MNRWYGPLAGKTISQLRLNIDGSTQPAASDIYLQEIVFVSGDGTVRPLFSQKSGGARHVRNRQHRYDADIGNHSRLQWIWMRAG
jgi:hypothetical protein